jgi:superfamily II DNA or RNA helicase
MKFRKLSPDKGYCTERLWLPLKHIQNIAGIKHALTFPMERSAPIHAWYETKTHLVVPRSFIPYERWGDLPFEMVDRAADLEFPVVSWVEPRSELRGPIQRIAYTELLEGGSGVLSLSCGKGKTVVGLHAWAATGVPCLVVVHTEQLLWQWVERIREHTNVPETQIGVFQGKKQDWEQPICVAMIQTLAARIASGDLPDGFEEHFGVVIYDEVHHLGAPWFNTTASVGKGVRWGLSATPERTDGLDALYKAHIGDILYQNLDQDIIPECFFVRTGLTLSKQEEQTLQDRTGEVSIAKLMTWLANNKDRNELIIEVIDQAGREGRKVLALSLRVDQLKTLGEAYDGAGVIHGGVKGKKRQEILYDYNLIFATTQLAKEGLDRKDLDTVAILLPITDENMFRQILGRIQRELEDKETPFLLVFEDEKIPICRAMCQKLRRHLTKFQYPFKNFDP